MMKRSYNKFANVAFVCYGGGGVFVLLGEVYLIDHYPNYMVLYAFSNKFLIMQ